MNEVHHVGPLIDQDAVKMYLSAIEKCKAEGGNFITETGVIEGKGYESGCYVKPCIAEVKPGMKIVSHETFAPVLYVLKYKTLAEAIAFRMVFRKDYHRRSDMNQVKPNSFIFHRK